MTENERSVARITSRHEVRAGRYDDSEGARRFSSSARPLTDNGEISFVFPPAAGDESARRLSDVNA